MSISNNKLGILTFFNVKNYGAVLQAFALQNYLKRIKYDSEFINYIEKMNNDSKKSNELKKYFNIIKSSGYSIKKFSKTGTYRNYTNQKFDEFRKEYLKISKNKLYSIDDFKEVENNYNGFITGSDMVWTDIGQNLDVYFLRFTKYEKRIAYSPSLTGTSDLSPMKKEKIKNYIKEIKYLSCREQEGVDFAKTYSRKNALLTVDPTLLLSRDEWVESLHLNQNNNQKYILFYMFGSVPTKVKKAVQKIARKKGLQIRYVPMSIQEEYSEVINGFNNGCGPKEFVELFLNATAILTNSYHGLLFSIIFKKPFILFHRKSKNKWKKNEERMSNILRIINAENRFINIESSFNDDFMNNDINYCELDKKIVESKNYLNSSIKSLPNALKMKKEFIYKNENINVLNINKCTGCMACSNACPRNCINSVEKDGFIYPEVGKDCIKCGLCVKSCPELNHLKLNKPIKSLLAFSEDAKAIYSSSGGIFYELGKTILEKYNGVVVGAAFLDNSKCVHKCIKKVEELILLQSSKYVQSDIGDSYSKTKELLEKKRIVLFAGTPCQISGLKKFLNRDYNNLFTIDIFCHGVPSPYFFQKHLFNYTNGDMINNISFRNKNNINKSSYELCIKTNKKTIKKSFKDDVYYNLFMKGDSCRLSCYNCIYTDINRIGDISIGDCDSKIYYKDFYPDKTKSSLLINTEKGILLFNDIKEIIKYTDLDLERESYVNKALSENLTFTETRNTLYKDLYSMDYKEFVKKYNDVRFKIKLKRMLKKILSRRNDK